MQANSEDPDQTPHSVASDLGLHCLPVSQKRTLGIYGIKKNAIILLSHKSSRILGSRLSI